MFLNSKEMSYLIFATKKFTAKVPNRWRLVSDFMNAALATGSLSSEFSMNLLEWKDYQEDHDGRFSENQCKYLYKYLVGHYPSLFTESNPDDVLYTSFCSQRNGLKPYTFLPAVDECILCGGNLSVISKPSYPMVFTNDGTSIGASYTAECRCCADNPRFNSTYYTKKSDRNARYYYANCNNDTKYFLLSSQSAFEVSFLERCTNEIDILGASFDGISEVYNTTHSDQAEVKMTVFQEQFAKGEKQGWLLHPDRLQDAWFLHRIASREEFRHPNAVIVEYNGHHLDLESVCDEVNKVLEQFPNKWISHECLVSGCKEGYVTIDGNEKLRRSICAQPRLVHTTGSGLRIVEVCGKDPQFANQSSTPNRFCKEHMNERTTEDSSCDHVQIFPQQSYNLRSSCTSDEVVKMAETERSLPTVCKDPAKVKKFYNSTAGMIAGIKPCGIVVGMSEMLTCESLTQAFLFVLGLMKDARMTNSDKLLRFVGYDRACELKPFISKLSRNGDLDAEFLLSRIEFLVDIFHVEKHTKPSCMPLENPRCEFHPKLTKFAEISGANTESCEQGFRRLNRYKYITKKMTRSKRKFFFSEINDRYNQRVEKRLRKSFKM